MWKTSFTKVGRCMLRQYCDAAGVIDVPGGAIPTLTGERGVNKAILVGRVGRDPEVRGSESHPVTLFSLATSQSFKKPDGTYQQYTDWHRICVFRPVLRDVVANIIKKGDKVYVSGAIKYSQYESDKGTTVKSTSIVAEDVINLTNKRDGSDLPDMTGETIE